MRHESDFSGHGDLRVERRNLDRAICISACNERRSIVEQRPVEHCVEDARTTGSTLHRQHDDLGAALMPANLVTDERLPTLLSNRLDRGSTPRRDGGMARWPRRCLARGVHAWVLWPRRAEVVEVDAAPVGTAIEEDASRAPGASSVGRRIAVAPLPVPRVVGSVAIPGSVEDATPTARTVGRVVPGVATHCATPSGCRADPHRRPRCACRHLTSLETTVPSPPSGPAPGSKSPSQHPQPCCIWRRTGCGWLRSGR